MTKINRDDWIVNNPNKLQKFSVGECFVFKNEVLKIGYVCSLSGIKTGDQGHFFTITDCGDVEYVAPSMDKLLNYFSDRDLIFKVLASGFENGKVVYTPVYGEG